MAVPVKEPRGDTRQRLLTVAAHLFRTKGYAATSTREIARHLRIQTASLYHYIRSKDQLLFEIARQGLEELEAEVRPIVFSALPPLEKLRRFIETHVTIILRYRDKHAVMLAELNALPARSRRAVVALRDRYEGLVARVLEEGQAAGVVRADLPVRYLRLALLNLLNWSIFWFRPDGPLAPDEVGRMLSSVFIDGVAVGASRPGGGGGLRGRAARGSDGTPAPGG